MKRNSIFWLLALAVFLAISLPTLVQRGTFSDATIYNAIAHNMSQGIGSYLKPVYIDTANYFYSHPPLMFILESFFYDIFGDSFLTEKLYALTIALLLILGVVQLWKALCNTQEEKDVAWMPVLALFTVPLLDWAFKQNILENTTSLFALFSVLFITLGLQKNNFGFSILSALFVWLAFLSKGFVGLFPLATPLLYAIAYKDYKKPLLFNLSLLVFAFLFYFLSITLFPDLKSYLNHYYQIQVTTSYQVEMYENSNNRLKLISDLLWDSIIMIVIVAIIAYLSRRAKIKITYNANRILYLFLIALSASMPLILSSKQRKFYLTPSFPYYAMAFSFVILPYVLDRVKNISTKSLNILRYICLAIIVAVLIFSAINFGKYERDKEMMRDIEKLSQYLPNQIVVNSKLNDYNLQANLVRNGNIYLIFDSDTSQYFLTMKQDTVTNYNRLEIGLEKYDLHQKK